MTTTTHPLLDLRQGRVSDNFPREPEITLPYFVTIDTKTMGRLHLTQCHILGEIFVSQEVDGFTIGLTELARAGFRREAHWLLTEYMHRALIIRRDNMRAELLKVEKSIQTFAPQPAPI